MSAYTPLGPGKLTLGTAPEDFTGEFLGAGITHEYEDVGDKRTMLDGTPRLPGSTRSDGFKGSVENDLTAAGLYAYLVAHDGEDVALTYSPRLAGGAEWVGTVKCRLPGEIGADEFGSPVASDVELPGVGLFTFTPEDEG